MNFEAAMIVMNRPQFFSNDQRWQAANFMMNATCPPSHIKCDFEAIQRRAFVVKCAAHEAIRCAGRWPS